MAIVTGELYKGFTFGDVSSKDYGVYITQEAAYNAPDRDVEVVEIAGRNGAYILDKGRFENITVSYKCGIALDDEQSFESAIRTFRNALSSKAGKYVRLEDEYNPNEFRQAAFLGGIEVDMADRRAGEFTVSFDAMPQRFLKSGETAVSVASGGTINNPTLFESHPLLQVWGYGGLAINGEPLRINSTAIGDVNISGSYRSEIVENSVSAPISLDVLNNNDLFYFERPIVTVYLVGDFVPSTNEALTIVSNGLVVHERGYGNAVGERCIYAALVTRNGYIGRFKGITDTSTHQTSITIGGSVVATFNVVESYNADGSTWGWSVTGLPSDANGYVAMYYARLWGKSTKSALGEPLYFDLDIGEAYKIEDEQIISVNNAVTIPAKLPALKSGNNTITYDRTITQFQVVPNWWEV
jgi:phage-related protein